ncbi:MAG: alkyl hydroperoxide reductase [Oscillatoriales cyanobacterium CG2_30_44_21]|nr:MAG: alkyl hydroperoxide reductase [Oscillatoriales cyanobacterium CG2_30_44_21]
MSLTEDLASFSAQSSERIPPEVKAVMQQAAGELATSGIVNHSLRIGDKIPDVILPNVIGETVSIQNLLKYGSVVISFYRGGWCPYCNLELRALQQALPEIQAQGAILVAISPQTPDNSLSTVEKTKLSFEVLSDVGNYVAREFGLVFTVPENLRPIYANFGIDLPASNGDQTFELPIPATYIINTDGTITYAFVDTDYTQRLDPEKIITVLKDLK